MAGHSQFKNIMHRKGAQDKKRAKIFTKILREIYVAVKSSGSDPSSNPKLRVALISAREANMPKDNVERAIAKASGEDAGTDYIETRYEGYGPGGVAVIVECLTDNRNRTAPEVRFIFSKAGGNMGESGSVSFMFDRFGYLRYPAEKLSADEMFEAALEAGAENVESNQEGHEIYCSVDDFATVRDSLTAKLGDPESGKLIWKAKSPHAITDLDSAQKFMKFMDALEDNDDVQNVWDNADIPNDIAEKLS
ncbi:MAG: YebC/PmpR family DNA-binding transcriptional regulator [Alphaproteobacteria bacterium]|nr:YebC/PmpR family DNA-binding transcriptional regulator [Alphaproteobacteria bacterium]